MAAEDASSLRKLRERARGPSKTITTFGPEAYDDIEPVLAQFDVDVVHEPLPIPESSGYLVVKRGEEYLGAISAAAFGELRDPPEEPPWDAATRESAYRELVALLSGTSFEMAEKRRLVATAREVEDRAWRTGRGSLSVTFQSLAAFERQLPAYERLAEMTDLAVTVFGEPNWEPPPTDGIEVSRDETGELAEFWIVAFDGAGDDDAACALIAEELRPGTYTGVVTYDPAVVDDVVAYLDDVAASAP